MCVWEKFPVFHCFSGIENQHNIREREEGYFMTIFGDAFLELLHNILGMNSYKRFYVNSKRI